MLSLAKQQLVRCRKLVFYSTRTLSIASKPLVNLAVDDRTGIATLALNRPPINNINLDLLTAISNCVDEVQQNNSKGLIITSAFDKKFSGGGDLAEFYKTSAERLTLYISALHDMWLKLYGSAIPTAAAITGHCPGTACLLVLCCEYRVMCPNFTIGINETRLGLAPPPFFVASLRSVLSNRDAERALTLGTLFTTDEARRVGLIDEVASDKEDALARCSAFLLQFNSVSSNARAITKQHYRGRELTSLRENRDEESKDNVDIILSPKFQTNLGLFLESLKK